MRQPTILDLVRAVTLVAPRHPDVLTWWHAPAQRLRLAGELPQARPTAIELVVEHGPNAPDCVQIASQLEPLLRMLPRVRPHCGAAEPRPLFRLLSRRPAESA